MKKSSNRILFLVDHKHRDLPSLSLMAYFLKNMDIEAKLAPLGSYDEIINSFDPDFIVAPKPNHDFEKMMSWKLQGKKIIIIDSEGNHQDKNFTYKIRVKPDVYLFWNDVTKNKYLNLMEDYNTEIKTLGFYRSDFLYKTMQGFFTSREEILENLLLEKGQKTITIATASQDTHLSDERKRMKSKRRKRSIADTADYLDLVDNDLEIRLVIEDLIKKISQRYPDLNVVVKPHPNENVVYWNDFIQKIGNKNLKLLVGTSINQMLGISDLHIAKNACTTTSEARLYGVNSIEIHTKKSNVYFAEDHFLSNFIINNSDEIFSIIDSVLYKKDIQHVNKYENTNDIEKYIKKYMHIFDGLRCFKYAEYLASYIKDGPPIVRKSNFKKSFEELKNICLYLIVFLRNRLIIKYSRQRKIDNEINNVTDKNLRKTSKIGDKLVDTEYGLFDNRIVEGDELFWFKRFDNNKYIKNLIKSQ